MFTLDEVPVNLEPGSILTWTAEQFRRLEQSLKSLGRRQPYTPIWTAATTQPALGNGTLLGAYVELGSFLVVSIGLSMGSTTTFGTGAWGFSLPRIPVQRLPAWYGDALGIDASTGTRYSMVSRTGLGSANVLVSSDGAVADIGVAVPFAWAVSDGLAITIGYPLE